MITNEETWRAELKQRGVENVKLKLLVAAVSQQTMVDGFNNPPSIPRSFVEDWVAEEERRAAEEERKAAEIMRRTLHWAIMAGVTGILVLAATLFGLVIELAHWSDAS
jgi:hypothetical protein